MPLVDHLRELRRRLTWSALAYAAAVAVTYAFWSPVFDVLRQPYCGVVGPGHCNLVSFGIFDQFQVRMRVGFIGGAVLSSPVWLYQLGAFITPALHRKERRYAAGFLLAALVFFAVGAGFAYLLRPEKVEATSHVGQGFCSAWQRRCGSE